MRLSSWKARPPERGSPISPAASLACRAAGARSTTSTASAALSTASGTVPPGGTPVIAQATSLSDSTRSIVRVEMTSTPPASRSSTSSHRLRCRDPGGSAAASSSTRATSGRRVSTASVSRRPAASGTTSSPQAPGSVADRLWACAAAMTTSRPSSRSRRPSSSIAQVVPTPWAAPSSTLNRPRAVIITPLAVIRSKTNRRSSPQIVMTSPITTERLLGTRKTLVRSAWLRDRATYSPLRHDIIELRETGEAGSDLSPRRTSATDRK